MTELKLTSFEEYSMKVRRCPHITKNEYLENLNAYKKM